MIRSFKDAKTAELFENRRHKSFVNIATAALRRLDQLSAAKEIIELREPPGNRLEALKGDRKGQYSVRINDQFRVCFSWSGMDAYDVEIVDYHG